MTGNVRTVFAVLIAFPLFACAAERDPFHVPGGQTAPPPETLRYAGIVGDGRCWSRWLIDSGGQWHKSLPGYCPGATLPQLPYLMADAPSWCPAPRADGRYPFSCVP